MLQSLLSHAAQLSTSSSAPARSAVGIVFILVLALALFAVAVFVIAAQWRAFIKAGKPGWAVLVPFYSGWTLAKIGGKPGWWGLVTGFSIGFSFHSSSSSHTTLPTGFWVALAVYAVITFVFYVLIAVGVARNFGKQKSFAALLVVLPFIAWPILGFGDAQYQGAAPAPTASDVPPTNPAPPTVQPPATPSTPPTNPA